MTEESVKRKAEQSGLEDRIQELATKYLAEAARAEAAEEHLARVEEALRNPDRERWCCSICEEVICDDHCPAKATREALLSIQEDNDAVLSDAPRG